MAGYGDEISSISLGSIIGGAMCSIVEAQSQAASTTVNFIKEVGFQSSDNNTLQEPVYVGFQYEKTLKPNDENSIENYSVKVINSGQGYNKNKALKLTAGNKELDASISYNTKGGIKSVNLKSAPSGLKGTYDIQIDALDGDTSDLPSEEFSAKLQLIYSEKENQKQVTNLKVPLLTMMPIPFIRIDDATIDFNVKINSIQEAKTSSDLTYKGSTEATANYNGFLFKSGIKINASISNQKKSSTSDTVKRDYSLNVHVHAKQDDMPAGVERLLDLLSDATSIESYTESSK
jgi:hypothetical protein